jgi:DNA-binding CsgD family transcriptional regulator
VLAVDIGMEVAVVRVALELDHQECAAIAIEEAMRRADLNPDCSSVSASAQHARGLRERSTDLLREAAEQFDVGERPLLAASAFEDLGCELLQSARADQAVEPLVRSLELWARAGADWDIRRLRRRLRRLGVDRRLSAPTRPTSGWEALTSTELAVANLVAQGQSNRQAADALFVSPNTVSAHLRHVFEKLGIHSRVELARVIADGQRSTQ